VAAPRKKLNVDKVLTQIVALGRYPVAALSFSRVSQLTGIPRSTLYYYFGNSKEGMLAEAIRFGMKGYVQLISLEKKNRRQYADWQSFQRARLRIAAATVRKYPWAPTVYFRFRGEAGVLGEAVREIEMRYARELGETWKTYHPGRIPDESAIRLSAFIKLGFLWGLATDQDYWYRQIGKKKLAKVLDSITELTTGMMSKQF
jgi:AcrR family transcriptional regulator